MVKLDIRNTAPKTRQFFFNLFAFFIAYPFIDIFGISITFFIFIIIILLNLKVGLKVIDRHHSNKWFFLIFALGTISTLFHPPLLDESIGLEKDLKTILQFFYWFFLAIFIRTNFHLINWISFGRWVLIGLISLTAGFYLTSANFEIGFLGFSLHLSRNSYIFNFLCFFPIVFWYICFSRIRRLRLLVIFFFLYAILLTNGRSGFLLIVLQSLLISIIIFPRFKTVFRISLIGLLFLAIVWQASSNSLLMNEIGDFVKPFNPRASMLIKKEGLEGDLSTDKSWQTRQIMIDKSIEIFKDYPLMGIGWIHFSSFNARLNSLNEYERLRNVSTQHFNARSSHNSYFQYLAEGGALGFSCLIIILLIAIKPFFIRIVQNRLEVVHLPLVALVVMLIYFYSIAMITGAATWFIVGLSLGLNNAQIKDHVHSLSPSNNKSPRQ